MNGMSAVKEPWMLRDNHTRRDRNPFFFLFEMSDQVPKVQQLHSWNRPPWP
jgi:hypothetical protein